MRFRLHEILKVLVGLSLAVGSSLAVAETWYYISFAASAKSPDQKCILLPGGVTPMASLSKHVEGELFVLSDKTTADQARVLTLSEPRGGKYAYATTVKACLSFREPIVKEAERRKNLDNSQWYVAQLTKGDCIPMREMFGEASTPEALHRQMTKDGTQLSLERRGDRVRLLSFDQLNVPALHLVKGEASCEAYVKR